MIMDTSRGVLRVDTVGRIAAIVMVTKTKRDKKPTTCKRKMSVSIVRAAGCVYSARQEKLLENVAEATTIKDN